MNLTFSVDLKEGETINKRIKKKKEKIVIENIQKIKLDKNDILLFTYDLNKVGFAQIDDFSNYVKNMIFNRAIFIPKEMDVKKVELGDGD